MHLKILICRLCLLLSYYLPLSKPEIIAFQVPRVLYTNVLLVVVIVVVVVASVFETFMLSFVKWGWNSTNYIPLSAGCC